MNVTGNVSIAGSLTYDDVTNVDSVGVITARSGIQGIGIQSGGINVAVGVLTALNFIGAGNTFKLTGNTIDISIQVVVVELVMDIFFLNQLLELVQQVLMIMIYRELELVLQEVSM